MVYKKFVKRFLDIFLSLIGLPFLFLVLAVLAPIIHFTDKGPVFYNAPRLGKNGRIFRMIKLRSMSVGAPDLRNEDGSTFNAADDRRVTRVGRLMREYSLDELPQLLNVLKGDMSLVGPRPDLPDHLQLYSGSDADKLKVRPGMTGYNQAYFRNAIIWQDRLKNDVYYVKHLSFLFDLKILFRTFYAVFDRQNLYLKPENKEADHRD